MKSMADDHLGNFGGILSKPCTNISRFNNERTQCAVAKQSQRAIQGLLFESLHVHLHDTRDLWLDNVIDHHHGNGNQIGGYCWISQYDRIVHAHGVLDGCFAAAVSCAGFNNLDTVLQLIERDLRFHDTSGIRRRFEGHDVGTCGLRSQD